MKTKITSVEIGLIQYVCECLASQVMPELSENGRKIAKRISQITNNLLVSDENQVSVNDLPVEDRGYHIFLIKQKRIK